MQVYTAKLSEKKVINQCYLWLHFELVQPYRLEFQAGQYILMDIPGLEQKRQYSIASEPQMDHAVELIIDITPDGKGSQYLSKLKPGDTISFRAPIGVFVIEPSDSEDMVFVATGSGVAPFKSMITDLLVTQKETKPIKLYWGMRYVEDLFLEEEFYQLDQDYQNFSFELILSQPSKEWILSKGYVTDLLEAFHKNYLTSDFYICGSDTMVSDVVAFLEAKNTPDSRIHFERYN